MRSSNHFKEIKKEFEIDDQGHEKLKRVYYEEIPKSFLGLTRKEKIDLLFRIIGLLTIFVPIILFLASGKKELEKQKSYAQYEVYSGIISSLYTLTNIDPQSAEFRLVKDRLQNDLKPKLFMIGDTEIISHFKIINKAIDNYIHESQIKEGVRNLDECFKKGMQTSGTYLDLDTCKNEMLAKFVRIYETEDWGDFYDSAQVDGKIKFTRFMEVPTSLPAEYIGQIEIHNTFYYAKESILSFCELSQNNRPVADSIKMQRFAELKSNHYPPFFYSLLEFHKNQLQKGKSLLNKNITRLSNLMIISNPFFNHNLQSGDTLIIPEKNNNVVL